MSTDAFELMQHMDQGAIETQLVLQCTPVLVGLKVSNLLTIEKQQLVTLQQYIQQAKLSCYVLLKTDKKVAVLVYQKYQLVKYLCKQEIMYFLQSFGYCSTRLEDCLERLSKRYETYWKKTGEFPHEMGIFLGYPMEDVQGFIEKEGREFLLNGYWKVYHDQHNKKLLFEKYETAKDWMILLVSNGMDLNEAAKLMRQGRLYSIYI